MIKLTKSYAELEEAKKVLVTESQCIMQAASKLDQGFIQALDSIENSIKNGGKIIVTGIGKSGKIGAKIAATFTSMGLPSVFLHPTDAGHGDLGILRKNDCIIAVSYSGNAHEVLALLPRIKALNIQLISIVGQIKSLLANSSDVILDGAVSQEACTLNLAPTSSTTVALALGDALAVVLSMRFGLKESDFAENHPSGALGRRLTLKVSDLMKSGSDLPWVDATTLIDRVIEVSTEKKLGAVLVRTNSGIGIITDGDIRRSLKFKEKFFSFCAKDIMTSNPLTVGPNDKALRALEIMENRTSQISVLPVCNENNECIGLVRLHDIIGQL